MLSGQRRGKLAGIEIREVEHLHLGESEVLLDAWAYAHGPNGMDSAPHHRRRLDLHARAVATRDQSMDARRFGAAGLYLQSLRIPIDRDRRFRGIVTGDSELA
jgi:hypothetical protein